MTSIYYDVPYVTFFYSPFCRACEEVLPRVVEEVQRARTMVIARTPNLAEKHQLPAVPALLIPKGVMGQEQPVLMIGSKIPEWLESLHQTPTTTNG